VGYIPKRGKTLAGSVNFFIIVKEWIKGIKYEDLVKKIEE